MKNAESLRHDIETIVDELRTAVREISADEGAQTNVVNNARDRLRYISALTEQAAGRTLGAAENMLPIIKMQKETAASLARKTRSPELRAFLMQLQEDHTFINSELSEVIQAQAFQDLVGQVVNKLAVTVQKMEDSLAHLLIEDDEVDVLLSGPVVREDEKCSQADVDDLFG